MNIIDTGTGSRLIKDTGNQSGISIGMPQPPIFAYLRETMKAQINGKFPPSFGTIPPAWDEDINIYEVGVTDRNAGLWCGNTLDLTAVAASGLGGILITPRDVIYSEHTGFEPTVVFIDLDGCEHEIPLAENGLTQVGTTDLRIATLEEDVPSGISYAKVLPSNYRELIRFPSRLPCMFTNQDGVILIAYADLITSGKITLSQGPAPFSNWSYGLRGGDSGSAIFVRLFDTLVALASAQHGEDGAILGDGPNIADYIDEINEALDANNSPYRLHDDGWPDNIPPVDLSPFE